MNINRLSNEEDNHELIDDIQDAELIMEHSMGFLWDVIIEPNEEQLDTDEIAMLGIVGVALRLIAKKAKAYEDMYEKGQNNSNSLN
jgi:ornithine cyclodeaminase/alanine dehydrogenase-like protein (mu-crystallin family)